MMLPTKTHSDNYTLQVTLCVNNKQIRHVSEKQILPLPFFDTFYTLDVISRAVKNKLSSLSIPHQIFAPPPRSQHTSTIMLTETLLLATARTPTDNVDAPSVSLYNLHTGAVISTLKRSHTASRGLAATATHLFAQQSDKSVVSVYSTATYALQTTVPFPEPFTVLAASPCGAFVAGGTAGGRVYLWELASGRFVATPAIHLQKITALAFGKSGAHVIAGSEDTNVSVWSVPALLDTRATTRVPERVLDRHIHAITAVTLGKAGSGGASELLVTAGRDRSVIAWELHTGQCLRTFIMGGVPLSLALDPVERALYVGLEEGGIQAIEFQADKEGSGSALFEEKFKDMPVTVEGEVWGDGDSPVLSLAMNYEGNLLISGNSRGEVGAWDVATGALFKNLCRMKGIKPSLKLFCEPVTDRI